MKKIPLSSFYKNHPLVKLAFENILPLEWWKQSERTPKYWTVKAWDGTTKKLRHICVIHDNFFNAYAFEYLPSVYNLRDHWEFVGYICGWDKDEVLPKNELAKWLIENAIGVQS